MKYDINTGKIIVSLSEFVSLARRSVSATATPDEEEPRLRGLSERVISGAINKALTGEIRYEFAVLGRTAEILMRADEIVFVIDIFECFVQICIHFGI